MTRIKKATEEEKSAYLQTKPCYPLYGHVMVGTTKCLIEDLRCWRPPDPIYEVMAPHGMVFEREGLHHLLCHSLKDIQERLRGETVGACERPCEWCQLD